MFGHYMKSAFRSLKRDRQFGGINILGLAVALAAAILILLFIRDELSYDDWGPETNRLFRLEGTTSHQDGSKDFIALSPGRMRDPLANDFAGDIEAISRMYFDTHLFVEQGSSDVLIDTVTYVDPGFFDIFPIPALMGDRDAVFSDNTSVLLTESMARKHFGDANPVGQVLNPDDVSYSLRVVGVIPDLPEHTHLAFDAIALFDPARYIEQPWIATYWQSQNIFTYLKLAEASDPATVEQALPAFMDRNVIPDEAPGIAGSLSQYINLRLMPVADIHLNSSGRFQMKPTGDMGLVISFGIVAGLIVFIACVNFVNLATARASLRAREIAVRKVVGAQRGQLMSQFLTETLFSVAVSLIIALALVEVTLPYFNEFIAKVLALDLPADPTAMLMVAGLLVVVALGAGLQPAVQITRVRPGTVLHSSGSARLQGNKMRAALVTLQFAISIGLIVVTLIVNSQTTYTRNKDLGFELDNRLLLAGMWYKDVAPVAETLAEEIKRLPGVEEAVFSYRALPLRGKWGFSFQKLGDPTNTTYNLEDVPVSHGLLDFLDAKLIAGRMFDENRALDQSHTPEGEEGVTAIATVVNRQAAAYLGYESPEAAVGQSYAYEQEGELRRVTIIGVVEDMNLRSLRDPLEPLSFYIPTSSYATLNVKTAPGQERQVRQEIELVWKQHVSTYPLRMTSYAENYGRFYEADEQRGELFGLFAVFAVFVSSIGLFSQAAYSAQRRTKEISLRKLMGASTFGVMRLMIWQLSKPVLFASLVAWPVAWMISRDWLAGFAYRIDLTPTPFLFATLIALAIAVLTVTYQALRVAGIRPVLALRHE